MAPFARAPPSTEVAAGGAGAAATRTASAGGRTTPPRSSSGGAASAAIAMVIAGTGCIAAVRVACASGLDQHRHAADRIAAVALRIPVAGLEGLGDAAAVGRLAPDLVVAGRGQVD